MTTTLWAPWRMEYLRAKGAPSGCFLCNVAGDPAAFRENLVVIVQPHALVCLNRYPFASSHLLVAARRHVADPADLEPDEYAALMTLVRESSIRLRRAVACEGINIGFNIGKAAGASVADHLHGHVVPRWSGDTSFMPVVADVRVLPEYLDVAWRRVRDAFADVPGERGPDPDPGVRPIGAESEVEP